MRVAALYDIHGNLPALEAVLSEVAREGADRIVAGGDVVFGPMPGACLACLEASAIPVSFVRGNADREVALGAVVEPDAAVDERRAWVAAQLDVAQRTALGAWPTTVTIAIDGLGPVLFCHGTPRSDSEIVTRVTPERRLATILADVAESVVVGGHTHVQYDRRAAGKRLINAGSVGMPYEAEPGAYWAMLGPEVSLRHTPFDLAAAADAIRATTMPDAADYAADYVLTVVSAEKATAHFEKMAVESDHG